MCWLRVCASSITCFLPFLIFAHKECAAVQRTLMLSYTVSYSTLCHKGFGWSFVTSGEREKQLNSCWLIRLGERYLGRNTGVQDGAFCRCYKMCAGGETLR